MDKVSAPIQIYRHLIAVLICNSPEIFISNPNDIFTQKNGPIMNRNCKLVCSCFSDLFKIGHQVFLHSILTDDKHTTTRQKAYTPIKKEVVVVVVKMAAGIPRYIYLLDDNHLKAKSHIFSV